MIPARDGASFVKYPRGRLYAIIDEPGAAARAVDALATAGFDASRVEVMRGDTAADAVDGTGIRHGLRGRVRRALEFTLMDQAPDLAWYEAALRSGSSVVAVRTANDVEVRRAVDTLRGFGGHFINYFGRFATEEFERWHGPEPTLPDYLRR